MSSELQGLRLADLNGDPLRIPNLTYRNRPLESAGLTYSDYGDPSTSSTKNVQLSTAAENNIVVPSQGTSHAPSYDGPRRSSASAAVNRSDVPFAHDDTKRKKHSSLFGFLSLKEPSISALEDFARQQHKQAAAKGGRATAVGIPGSSTQKLPTSVPKVNSRWDGLPSPVIDRPRNSRSGKRDSTFTVTSHGSTSSSSSSSKASSRASLSSECCGTYSSPLVPPISEVPELPTQESTTTSHEPGTSAAIYQLAVSGSQQDSQEQSTTPRWADNHTTTQRSSHEGSIVPRERASLPTPSNPPSLEHDKTHRSSIQRVKAEVLPWETQDPPPPISALQGNAIPRKEGEKKRKLGFLTRRHR